MRACTQCGLSIGDAATYCAVCGARYDPAASIGQAPAPEETPTPQPAVSAFSEASVQDRRESPGAEGESPAERHERGSPGAEDQSPPGRREPSLPMREASRLEKADPAQSAALYRQAALGLLGASADPLDHKEVRRDLLWIFDRLSLVLKRQGLPADALEEIDCAASLGLLDCRDYGVKGHREALTKRRESLRRALDGHPPSTFRAAPPRADARPQRGRWTATQRVH
jgi:hypothetical protein